MTDITETTIRAEKNRTALSVQAGFLIIGLLLLLLAPFFFYPIFLMKLLVLRALCLRLQPAARLYRPALLRARHLLRRRCLFHRLYGEGVGLAA